MKRKSKMIYKRRIKKKTSLKNLFLFYSFLFVVLVVATAYLSRYDSLQVTGIAIEGIHYSNEKEIKEKVDNNLNGNYLGLFSKRNKYLINEENILGNIKNITTVAEATVKIIDQKINVSVIEHEPVGLWCDEYATTTPCYFVNQDGIAFGQEPLVYDDEVILLYKDFDTPDLKKEYADKQVFQKIILLNKLFIENGFDIDFAKRLNNENYLFRQKDGLIIYFDIRDDAEYVFNNLKIVRGQIEDASIMPAEVEYIDLRFGNRIYYKLK